MFCKNCGSKIDDDSVFCCKCGTRVTEQGSSPVGKVFSNKCESCGAQVKEVSEGHYLCEYCGSEYYVNERKEVSSNKLTDKQLLDLFYKAAEFSVKNKFWEELQCLLSAEAEASDNTVYLVKLGRAYRRNNMFGKALECYEKARQLNSEYANIYTNIGAVYLLGKQYDKAVEPCRKAVMLMNRSRAEYSADDYNTAYANMAIAAGMVGDMKDAVMYLKAAEDNGYKNGENVRRILGIKS